MSSTLDLKDEKPTEIPLTTDPRVGKKLLQYRILAAIGQGGMSVVYRGQDERLGREVAIKVLHSFLAQSSDSRARIAREAKIVAKLQHPHILQIYDYSGEDLEKGSGFSELFIVTELVKGITLKEFADQFALHETPELGALIIWETALALQHAHRHGIIHRDLKPENIMVREDGVLKLMDFGIAQVRNQESLTVTGTLIGSPAHMAPEIIEGKPSDHRADIFSLSTVLYSLVTGQLPFVGKSPHALLKAIAEGRFIPPQQVQPKVFDGISHVILKGMAINPDDRFQSAEDMARAIEVALNELGIATNSTQLRGNLADPQRAIAEFKKRTIESCFKKIEELKQNGQTAKAMAVLGRILAENPLDTKAQMLLSDYEPEKKRSSLPFWIASLLVLAILGLTSVITQLFEKKRAEAEPDSQTISPNVPLPIDESPTPKPSPTEAIEQKAEPKNKVAAPNTTRALALTITPYADVYIDGKLLAKNISRFRINLPVGRHFLAFKHEYAATEERVVMIESHQTEQKLLVALEKAKPSALVVSSNVDADIALGGTYKGTSNASLSRPIVIPMPNKSYSINLEVVISKEGYVPFVAPLRFVAGQTKTLNAHLIPIQNHAVKRNELDKTSD